MKSENKNTVYIFTAIKWIAAVLAFALILTQLLSNRVSNAEFDTVSSAVIEHADMDMMQLGDNQMIKRLYGITPEDYEAVMLYYPTTNMGSEELLLVKLKDVGQQSELETAINSRLTTQMNNFNGYGTYQYGMLEKAIIDLKGNYVLFISCQSPDQVKQDFEKAL